MVSVKKYSLGLSVYRVVLSFLVLKNAIFYFPMADSLFGNNSIASFQGYARAMHFYSLDFLILPFNKPYFPQVFLLLIILFSTLFLLGIGRRLTGIVLYALVFCLNQRNGYILDGSDNVIAVTFPFLLLTNCFEHFTYSNNNQPTKLEGFASNNKYFKGIFTSIAQAGLIGLFIQISFVYFFTALHKLQGDLWLNGTATYYTMRVEEFRATELNIPLTRNHYFVVLTTYFTVFWELGFAFLVWFRNTKMIILIFGILLHVGIWVFMRIDNFSWIMIGSYSFFITNKEYGYLYGWIIAKLKVSAFYDDHCPNCIRFKRLVERLDWFRLVDFLPIRNQIASRKYQAINESQAIREMATISNSNKVKYGFDSILRIFTAIPVFFPFVPIMVLMKYLFVGKFLYSRVANSRTIFSITCNDDCLIKN